MARTRFAPDHGLSRRMGFTVFLLGLVYVGGIALIVAKTSVADLPFIVVIALIFLGIQWFASDKIALFGMGGRIVTPEQDPQLHATIDRLCALADMPKPKVAVADVDMPNAFATGRNQSHAVVCVTTGLMRRVNRDELEGVLSHELSHIAHRDVAVMTIASFLGVLAGVLTRSVLWFGGGFGGRRNNNGGGINPVMLVLLVSVAVYALSFLLIRALSRYREFAADRSGAQLTGRPSQLASALVKISGDMGRIPTRDLRRAEPFNAFYFAPAFARGRSSSLSTIFSTHPSTEQRIAALNKISLELGA
jgi:heat shock protein HtpX